MKQDESVIKHLRLDLQDDLMNVDLEGFIHEDGLYCLWDLFKDIDSHVLVAREAFHLCVEGDFQAIFEQFSQVLIKRVRTVAYEVEEADQKLKVRWRYLGLSKFGHLLVRWIGTRGF